MTKSKTLFECNECGSTYPKWQGQCEACSGWNTLSEKIIRKSSNPAANMVNLAAEPIAIKQVLVQEQDIIPTAYQS